VSSFGKIQHFAFGVKMASREFADRESDPSSPRTKTNSGCAQPFRPGRLNRDLSRRADFAHQRNCEVKPRTPIHDFCVSIIARSWAVFRPGETNELSVAAFEVEDPLESEGLVDSGENYYDGTKSNQ
jgi:hypothetical protein